MVDILFVLDFGKGHIFPTFKMAHNLKDHGFRVAFMGIEDVLGLVAKEGFDSYPIFPEIYPKGFMEGNEEENINQPGTAIEEKDLSALLAGELDEVMAKLKPKLIISSVFLHLEALIIHYKYGIPQMFYRTYLPYEEIYYKLPEPSLSNLTAFLCFNKIRNVSIGFTDKLLNFFDNLGLSFKSFDEVIAPVAEMPQLVICPKAFKMELKNNDPKEIYIGPGVRSPAANQQAIIQQYLPLNTGKKIIFASMGSMPDVYPEASKIFFKVMVDCMKGKGLQDFHLILATGGLVGYNDFDEVPDNISIFNWIPQVEILDQVSIAVIHGGLGTIKECIYYGVPMVVVPMRIDQFKNAQRVEFHQLGFEINKDDLTVERMTDLIGRIQHKESIKKGVQSMKNIFHQAEEAKLEIETISEFIQKNSTLKKQHNVPDHNRKPKLFCFPFAGGSKHSFRGFYDPQGQELEVIPLELPGRAGRIREPLSSDLPFLVQDLFNQIIQQIDGPYAFYGHSMGAGMAYLVTRMIHDRKLPLPEHLFFSGCPGPAVMNVDKSKLLGHLPLDLFIEALKKLGGIPDEILANEDVLNYFLSIARHDIQALDSYQYIELPSLNVPMTVMIGTEEDITLAEAYEWQKETTELLEVLQFPGNHFFPFEPENKIMDYIINELFENQASVF